MDNQLNDLSLENIVTTAIQIPGVKVSRSQFLSTEFPIDKYPLEDIINQGPIAAGVSEAELHKIADRVIFDRTTKSSLASFLAGIPGGLAMAATIPADLLQFFGISLRLAQELSYIFGASDFWEGDQLDDEKVRSKLIMYIGVMFGVSGAVAGVRVLSAQMAKVAVVRIPAKALMKTFWYPILKKILKQVGYTLTKKAFANGVAKVIPVLGGLLSGSLNFFTMKPMAEALRDVLNEASFHYSEEKLEKDIIEIENIQEIVSEDIESEDSDCDETVKKVEKTDTSIEVLDNENKPEKTNLSSFKIDDKIEQLRKLKELVDEGILTEDEFIKAKRKVLEI